MRELSDCQLYGIIDLGYIDSGRAPHVADELIEGGVDIVQLRAKQQPQQALKSLALALQALCRSRQVPFVVNDHVELAAEIGADALHLGQDDTPLRDARRAFAGLIGKSTHSLEQATAAKGEGADYIGFGPLFPTPTKPEYRAIGVSDIARVHASVTVPIFCIGGIKLENLSEVTSAGAQRVVIVSGLLQASDPTDYARRCKSLLLSIRSPQSEVRNS